MLIFGYDTFYYFYLKLLHIKYDIFLELFYRINDLEKILYWMIWMFSCFYHLKQLFTLTIAVQEYYDRLYIFFRGFIIWRLLFLKENELKIAYALKIKPHSYFYISNYILSSMYVCYYSVLVEIYLRKMSQNQTPLRVFI